MKYKIIWGDPDSSDDAAFGVEAFAPLSVPGIRSELDNVLEDPTFQNAARSSLTLERSYQRQQLPTVVDPESGLPVDPEVELRVLLSNAAEIEHGLMVQYLYSAYATTDELAVNLIMQVAVEEMGHLVTVLNLLQCMGMDPVLSRYDWNPDNEFAPFPFALEPPTKRSLAKYAVAEMPDLENVDQGAGQEAEVIGEILKLASEENDMQPQRVGLLYMKIYWLLRPADGPLPIEEPWEDFPVTDVARDYPGRHVFEFPLVEGAAPQARHDDWRADNAGIIVASVDQASENEARLSAMRAVARITAEGEGPGKTSDDAHFDQFVALFRQLDDDGSRPVPVDPWYRGMPSGHGEDDAEVSDPDSRALAELADVLYEVILSEIALYFLTHSNLDVSGFMATGSIALMKEALTKIGFHLTRLPRAFGKSVNEAGSAAICFGRPRREVGGTLLELLDLAETRLRDGIQIAATLEATSGNADVQMRSGKIRRDVLEPSLNALNAARGELTGG